MNLIKKLGGTQEIIEPGEELLHESYRFSNSPGKEVNILVGPDGGSTQTRVIILDLNNLSNFEEALGRVYVVPSLSMTVPDDRTVKPKSETLYDNLESLIVNLNEQQQVLFRSARLIRGTKAFNSELSENRLGSSTQKTEDVTYYYNILDVVGYALLMEYRKEVPERVNIWLSGSLPPDDINAVNIDTRLKPNLSSYRWSHLPSGVKVEMNFKDIHVMTEPEAYVKAYYAMADMEIPEFTLHLEGGGRSIGAEILVRGKSLDSAQETLEFGGTQLLNLINDLYVAKYGGRQLRRSQLEDAVRTGLLKDGNSSIDISEIISSAKKEMAKQIVIGVRQKVFDQQSRVAIKDLNVITVSGRLFDKTPTPDGKGVSVADYLKEEFEALSPSTDFIHLKGNYIPQGLILAGILEFFEDQLGSLEAAASEEEVPQD